MEKSSSQIPIPRTSEQVTIKWLESILKITINPNTFKKYSNITADFGSLSNIIRVEFEHEENCTNQQKQVSSSFIIKLLPVLTEFNANIIQIIIEDKFDQKEIFFYQEILPKLIKIEPELEKYFCKFYYGGCSNNACNKESTNSQSYSQASNTSQSQQHLDLANYTSAIILEDLTQLNYKMPRFNTGLESTKLDQIIKILAKLHYTGRKLQEHEQEQSKQSFLDKFPLLKDWRYPTKTTADNLFKSYKNLEWFPLGIQSVIKDLLIPNQVCLDLIEAYKKLIPISSKILLKVFEQGQKYPTIFHDDLWPHNFLIHDTDSDNDSDLLINTEFPIKIIDWQLIGWLDSMYDLSHCIFSCLPEIDLNTIAINKWLEIYLIQYNSLDNRQDYRSIEEEKAFFWTYGLAYSCIWFMQSADSIYANPNYVRKLIKIFEYFYEMGIVDFLVEICE